MQFAYEPLISISFLHTYYNNNKYPFLKAIPTKYTEQLLMKNGFVYKEYKYGLKIFYDTLFNTNLRTREEILSYPLMLRFLLNNTDPHLLNYTDACSSLNLSDTLFHFSNETDTEPDRFHSGKYVNGCVDYIEVSSFYGSSGFKKPFAILDIHTRYIKEQEAHIQFGAKSTFWRYALVAKHLLELGELSIVDKKVNSVFDGPVPHPLPDGTHSLLFTSKHLYPFSEWPNKDIQLVEKYNPATGRGKVVINKLPNPDLKQLSLIDATLSKADRMKYSDIIL